ncbi:hypothetical protein CFAM422_001133 [Trichoderma lentiforme]|uniref:Oxidoreductase acuF-like C2H2 type zinc-finger domain-containing protein n=1 Tax=Trichoderma lentiforme TaxID=1567552 RepID=A0A9P4XP94_9HYPO|nr:hypothetical protein CFAM422_001133 [Trichoderma lentiforme]
MEQKQTLPQKSRTVQKCFVDLINYLENNDVPNVISPSEITDALERFALWAGNLGALRGPTSKLSLEYRLAEAPEIRSQIHRQLDYLLEAIDDVTTLVQERQMSHDIMDDDMNMGYFDEPDDPEEGPSEEIRMNIDLISESLKTLFRIAVLVRKTDPDNRFERAIIHSSKITFPHTFDVDYVREKYPKLKTKEQSWLAERLGKAIARRRQFIKYCRDHRDRLALDDENIEAEGATTVLQSSKATTLLPENTTSNLTIDDYEDDLVSILSTSTTTDGLSTLALPRLVDLLKDSEAFECPICFTLRAMKGERSWRVHAFQDLKPYSCTVGGAECDSLAFQDRNSWFQHELDCHRSQYMCSLCEGGLFLERASLRLHILTSHGQFPEHQLQIIEDAGRKAPTSFDAQSCPFCNDWSVALQAKEKLKSQEIKSQTILVRTDRFKRHVAAHLEQLAIFAIPRATEDDGEDKRSLADSLGSNITGLPESEIQESLPTPGKGSLEERSTNDEDLLNADEGRDDDPSSPEQYAMGSTYQYAMGSSGSYPPEIDLSAGNLRQPFRSVTDAVQNPDLPSLSQPGRIMGIHPLEHVEEEATIPEAKWTGQEQNSFYGDEVSHMTIRVREKLQASNEESETNMATTTSSEELVKDRGATYKRVGHPGFETVNTAQNKKDNNSVDSSSRKQHAKIQTTSSEKLVHEQ